MNNSTASDEILAVIRNTLSNSGYNFSTENARIISGVEEAIGGWTTANYLDKNLNPPKGVSAKMHGQYSMEEWNESSGMMMLCPSFVGL